MKRRHFHAMLAASLGCSMPRTMTANEAQLYAQDAWYGWRGPWRNAYTEAKVWPMSLDESHLKLRWGVPLERSYSGPIVTKNLVITTESISKDERAVALELGTGKKVWDATWSGAMTVPFFAASNGSWIRSTPVTDGQKLFVGGMCDTLVCFECADGKEVYSIDFKQRFGSPLPAFGQVCSPLLDQGRLYIQSGGGLVCLNADSGETLWRTLDETDGMMSAFSSPIVASLHGQKQLVVQTRNFLCGVEPESGVTLWQQKVESFRGMNILTPTIWNNCVFTSSYGGRSLLFELEPTRSGPWKVVERWTNKAEAYMSSPVVIKDHLYMHLRNQRFVCIDLASGQEKWRSRPYGKYWSLVTNGTYILALDEQGKLFLIEADSNEFRLIDERQVTDDECWAHVAIVEDFILVRHLRGLMAFQWS